MHHAIFLNYYKYSFPSMLHFCFVTGVDNKLGVIWMEKKHATDIPPKLLGMYAMYM